MKKFPKWLKMVWLLCIPAGLVTVLLLHFFVHEAPEKELASASARTNSAVEALFGEVQHIAHNHERFSSVEFHSAQLRTGMYHFDISGTKDQGTILVKWRSKGSGEDFQILSIEESVNSERNRIIWERK